MIDSEQLTRTREDLRRDLDHLNSVLDNLDELGDIMVLMLTTQDSIEVTLILTLYSITRTYNLSLHRIRQKRH